MDRLPRRRVLIGAAALAVATVMGLWLYQAAASSARYDCVQSPDCDFQDQPCPLCVQLIGTDTCARRLYLEYNPAGAAIIDCPENPESTKTCTQDGEVICWREWKCVATMPPRLWSKCRLTGTPLGCSGTGVGWDDCEECQTDPNQAAFVVRHPDLHCEQT